MRRRATPSRRLALQVLVVAVALLYALPLVWMLSTSLKPAEQTLRSPPTLAPEPLSALPRFARENYIGEVGPDATVVTRGVWTDPVIDFPLFLRNSLVVALLSAFARHYVVAFAARHEVSVGQVSRLIDVAAGLVLMALALVELAG